MKLSSLVFPLNPLVVTVVATTQCAQTPLVVRALPREQQALAFVHVSVIPMDGP